MGIFITFEGIDFCGKSTQAQLFFEYLKKKKFNVILTKEPGGTPLAQKIRELILFQDIGPNVDCLTKATLFFAARRDHYLKLIRPSLLQNKIVICERFTDSTIAYQEQYEKEIIVLHELLIGKKTYPNITFILDINEETFLKRFKSTDNLESELIKHKQYIKIIQKYRNFTQNDTRYILIDGNNSVDDIFSKIKDTFNSILKKYYL